MNPWATVVSQWTLDDLYDVIDPDAASQLINATSDDDRDAKCTQRLQRMQRFYRQKLIQQFRQNYPDDLASIQTFIQGRVQRLREFNEYQINASGARDVLQPIGFSSLTDTSLLTPDDGVYGVAGQSFPRLYLASPPITAGLLANTAERGEFLGLVGAPKDGSDRPEQVVYINQGTKASPAWTVFDDDSLIDYLVNPGEILDGGYTRTVFYLQGYGTMIDDGDWDGRMKNMPTARGVTLKEALEAEALAFGLLRPSLDGSGIVSDFGKQTSKRRKAFF